MTINVCGGCGQRTPDSIHWMIWCSRCAAPRAVVEVDRDEHVAELVRQRDEARAETDRLLRRIAAA